MKTAFNRKRILQAFILLGAALLATSAFAANKGSLELKHPTQVAGKELPAGTYKVEWQGSGSEVKVNVMQGSKQVTSATAHMVPIQAAARSDSALITMNSDGSRTLAQLRFRGKAMALELMNDGSGQGGASSGQ